MHEVEKSKQAACQQEYTKCTYPVRHNAIVKVQTAVLYELYSMRGRVKRPIQDEAKPSAVWCLETPHQSSAYSTHSPCYNCVLYQVFLCKAQDPKATAVLYVLTLTAQPVPLIHLRMIFCSRTEEGVKWSIQELHGCTMDCTWSHHTVITTGRQLNLTPHNWELL